MQRPELEKELERLHPAAFGWALSCCGGDRSAAEDVLQASYLKILDERARFDGRSSFRTWVFGVVRHTASEERRRERLRHWLPWSERESADAESTLVRAESTRRLERALGALPARQREVLHLVFYEQLTIAEAAEILGVGLGTARTHYERGKAALRRLLEEDRE